MNIETAKPLAADLLLTVPYIVTIGIAFNDIDAPSADDMHIAVVIDAGHPGRYSQTLHTIADVNALKSELAHD